MRSNGIILVESGDFMKRILIVEDDRMMATGLQELLGNAGYEAVVLQDFANALEVVLDSGADLLLLDINIPYQNGEVLLRDIRKRSSIPVIMVTSRTSEVDEILSISAGADDYIMKPYNPTLLILRIQNIFRRLGSKGEVTRYRDLVVSYDMGILFKDGIETPLTKNEMIIFRYLLNNRGRIVSRDELMTVLWNSQEYINDNALTVNISRLRGKLAEFGYGDVICTRKGQGYILL